MADIVVSNPGVGGASFAVDTISGTTFPYVKITLGDLDQDNGGVSSSNPMPIHGAVGITSGAFSASTQIVSSIPFFVAQSSGPWTVSPQGTSYITLASTQVSIGGGTQYLDGAATSAPTGNIMFYRGGNSSGTMTAVDASTHAMPMNIVSSIALGFTPTGTSFVSISSSRPLIVQQSTTPWSVSSATLDLISSAVFADGATYVRGTSRLAAIGAIYSSTSPTLTHSTVAAPRINSSGRFEMAPGDAETIVSTTPLVRIGIWNDQDQQITAFGGGQQYTDGSVTTAPTGNAFMWKSLVSTMAVVSSSKPLPMNIVSSISLGFTPTGTSYVTLSSTQVTIGGGTQYIDGATTTSPTGNVMMYRSGNSSGALSAVDVSTHAMPVYIASSVALGFTPTGTSFVSISSSQPLWVSQSSSPWSIIGGVNVSTMAAVASTFALNVVSTFSVSPALTSTTPIPSAQGGLDIQSYISVTTSPKTIKNSAGKVYDVWFTNSATSTRWLKFFNASSASVSTGTTLPLMTFGLPGGTSAVSGWLGSVYGYQFSTAAAVACTASSATSTDTSAPGTNEVLLMIGYK